MSHSTRRPAQDKPRERPAPTLTPITPAVIASARRAHRVAASWNAGPYEHGPRNAARARVAKLAEGVGQDLGTFLRSCGLDVSGYAAVWRADEREGNLVPSKPRLRVKAIRGPAS